MVDRDDYPAIRDRLMTLARDRGLRADWAETTKRQRLLLLYYQSGEVAARVVVPLYPRESPRQVSLLERGLEQVFGKG